MDEFISKIVELFTTPEYIDSLLHGFSLTLTISFFAIIIAFVLGTIIALVETARPSKWLALPKFVCGVYTTVIRGTPMMSPEVLLFDEPTSALDPEAISDVLGLIRELADGRISMMFVTHEIGFAREIASRVVFIDQGRIIEEGAPDEFFVQPKTPRAAEFLAKVL